MAAMGLAVVASARRAASPPVPSRTTAPREVTRLATRAGAASAELRVRALEAVDRGQLPEAARLLEEAVSVDPSDALAWNALGVLLVRRGEAERGAEALARAVAAAPEFAEARLNLAVALDARGRGAEAASHYEAYLALAPGGDRARDDVRRRLVELGRAGARP